MSTMTIEAVLHELLHDMSEIQFAAVLSLKRNLFVQVSRTDDFAQLTIALPSICALIEDVAASHGQSPLEHIGISCRNLDTRVEIIPVDDELFLLCYMDKYVFHFYPAFLLFNHAINAIREITNTLQS